MWRYVVYKIFGIWKWLCKKVVRRIERMGWFNIGMDDKWLSWRWILVVVFRENVF